MNTGDGIHPATFDVVHPTAAEMAAAEADLQAIGSVEPLSANTVERLLQAPHAGVAVVPARRSWARPLVLAATILLAVSGIAWAGARVAWPVQRNSPNTLPLAEAIELATEPSRDDLARRSAIGIIVDHAGHAADTIATACGDLDPDVAATANAVRTELERKLSLVGDTPAPAVTKDVVELAQAALERSAGSKARAQAIQDLGEIVGSCLQALNAARFTTTEGERNRAAARDNLRDALRH